MSVVLLNPYPQPPPPVVLFSDNFTGTDGAGWNAAKWDSQAGSTLLSNQGKLLTPAGWSNATARALMTPTADVDILGSFQLSDVTNEAYARVYVRAGTTGTLVSPYTNYHFQIRAADGVFEIVKLVAGTGTNLATGSWPKTTAKCWIRGQVLGTALRARVWHDGDTEPGTWDVSASDSTHTTGVVALSHTNNPSGVARSALWDDITVTAIS